MKGFIHKVDKAQIPTCKIMGVDIAAIDMQWLLQFTEQHITELSGDYMCVSNVHTTVTAWEDASYCAVQNGGIMAIPDGGPLSAVGQRRGHKKMRRTTGPDYMGEILKVSGEKGYAHYFYGSTEETLEKLRERLMAEYPKTRIVGMSSPPFRKMTDEEDQAITAKIDAAAPDFLWVGLGAPKQERWMAAPPGPGTGFLGGVGAGFDYLAGNIERAPGWMQERSLEWVYRMWQEPGRLARRYVVTNSKFIWHAVLGGR